MFEGGLVAPFDFHTRALRSFDALPWCCKRCLYKLELEYLTENREVLYRNQLPCSNPNVPNADALCQLPLR